MFKHSFTNSQRNEYNAVSAQNLRHILQGAWHRIVPLLRWLPTRWRWFSRVYKNDMPIQTHRTMDHGSRMQQRPAAPVQQQFVHAPPPHPYGGLPAHKTIWFILGDMRNLLANHTFLLSLVRTPRDSRCIFQNNSKFSYLMWYDYTMLLHPSHATLSFARSNGVRASTVREARAVLASPHNGPAYGHNAIDDSKLNFISKLI